MRRRQTSGIAIAAAVAIVSLLLLLQLRLDIHWGARAEAFRQKIEQASQVVLPKKTQPEPEAQKIPFARKLLLEAEKVGQLTESPEAIEQNLNDWAKDFSEQDIIELRQTLFTEATNGDERALSLDLLGRSDLPSAQSVLVDYVLNPPPSSASEQAAFQLLALDGIIGQSARSKNADALRKVQTQSSDSLVAGRSAQALRALEGQGPWPEDTDNKALSELLEKSEQL